MIKRYVLPLAAMLFLVCGTAFAGPELPVGAGESEQYTADLCSGAAAMASHTSQVLEVRSLPGYQAPNTRSDMRVASAGLVFDRVDGHPHAESTVPS